MTEANRRIKTAVVALFVALAATLSLVAFSADPAEATIVGSKSADAFLEG